MLGRKAPQCLPHNGVILNFLLVLIAEYQQRGWRSFGAFFLVRRRGRRPRIQVLILFVAHALFFQALRVHLIGQTDFLLPVHVIGRTGIPPPGIIVAAPDWPSPSAAAAESEVTEDRSAKAIEITEGISRRKTPPREGWTSVEPARCGTCAGMHPADSVATRSVSAETTVSSHSAAVSAGGKMASTTLRHCRQ